MSDLLTRTIGEHIRVETVLSAGLWQVSADPNQLENAVLNLAVNARDAIRGPGKLTLEAANTYLDEDYAAAHQEVRAGQYVMLAVSDTGQGMTQDVMSRLSSHSLPPSGLAKAPVSASPRSMDLSSSRGVISRFTASPAKARLCAFIFQGQATHSGEAQARAATMIPSAREKETIFVVEDDDDVRAHSTDILRELGYRVFEAKEGGEALSFWQPNRGYNFCLPMWVCPDPSMAGSSPMKRENCVRS